MKSVGWKVRSDFYQAVAIGILLATPSLISKAALQGNNRAPIAILALSFLWISVVIVVTHTSWGARKIYAQLGLFGSAVLWLIFAAFINVNVIFLISYIATVAAYAVLWILVEDFDFHYYERNWIFPYVGIGTILALLLFGSKGFLYVGIGFILLLVLSFFGERYDLGLMSLFLIISPTIAYWWGFDLSQSPSTFLAVICITLAAVLSIGGSGLLLARLARQDVAQHTAWLLFASLVFLTAFLWIRSRFENPTAAGWIGLLTALILTGCVLLVRRPVDNMLSTRLAARIGIFQSQFRNGRDLFVKKEFAKAIPALQEAKEYWSDTQKPSERQDVDIMLAFALERTGHRTEALAHAGSLRYSLVEKFRKGNPWEKMVSLTLLTLTNDLSVLFRGPDADDCEQQIWFSLIDNDKALRAIARRTVTTAVPVSLPFLLKGFQVGDSIIQKQALDLLYEAGEAGNLLADNELFPNLFSALLSSNLLTHLRAHSIIVQGGKGATPLLLAGLYWENHTVREFSLRRLIELGELKEAVEQIRRAISSVEPKIIITILRAHRNSTVPEDWNALSNEMAMLGNPCGLDVLVQLRGLALDQDSFSQVWQDILFSLRLELPRVLAADIPGDALQAADLLFDDQHFLVNLLEALKTGSFEEKSRVFNLVARILFLLADQPHKVAADFVQLQEAVLGNWSNKGELESAVRIQLSSENSGTKLLPIPMIRLESGNSVLLLVNKRRYRLDMHIDPSSNLTVRAHFIVSTSDIPVRPSLHHVFDPQQANASRNWVFQLAPDDQNIPVDRLTVQMLLNGRGQRIMAYELFVCDPSFVLRGLEL